MENIKIGDLVSINKIDAIVTKVLDPKESVKPRCEINQLGETYCVLVSDLKKKDK